MSRGARRAIVAVVVVLGLLIAADRISLVVAERVAANSIKTSQHLTSTPSVSAKGFPFLTQLISGHYDEVDVTAHGLEVGATDRQLRIATVAVRLNTVDVSDGFKIYRAQTAVATATLAYADLSKAVGATVTYAGSGRVSASAGVTVAGVSVRGSVSVRPELSSSSTLSFADVEVSALGLTAPPALSQALTAIFGSSFSLADLPFGLRLTGLQVTSAGVAFQLSGSDIVYDSTTNQTS